MGGQGAGARCDVDRWFPAARVLASGEDRLVPTSSRLILRLSRLKFALLAVRSVGCGGRLGQWAGRGAGARCDVDRWFPAARVLASGEDQLVPTSSRLILRLSRLTFALSGVGGRRPRAVARSLAGEDHTTTPRWRARTRTVLSRRERVVSQFGKKNEKSTTWKPRTRRRSVGSRPTHG